jgi:hypothetical protein
MATSTRTTVNMARSPLPDPAGERTRHLRRGDDESEQQE